MFFTDFYEIFSFLKIVFAKFSQLLTQILSGFKAINPRKMLVSSIMLRLKKYGKNMQKRKEVRIKKYFAPLLMFQFTCQAVLERRPQVRLSGPLKAQLTAGLSSPQP